ncbi:hypothetical protein LEP1GSC077_2806 [Leptospira interrogans str. C10069]|uniref:Uncharacterized protein n=3 Tax=Leptospira interrogans TaxID=173 RepID=M6ZU47_LEPIR|nr:hypothetical protein LEP1GSC080_1916 [Leptospira interrogans str. FPW2026]EKO07648.1 hypothetical protein LEP1GSC077_2806 [Leptospira interrogans str. C10069]EMN64254.1 hypothetical protein LEP1GSC092_0429 [Leptospira interrogans serovar Pyrogenes str. R168]EMP07812.1 hypothetical protein LEP1GSC124_3529 [Leptospira interrogans serovar Pyrogenes str. 200701872]
MLCNKNLRYSNFIALSNIQILKRIQFEAKFYKIYTPNFSTKRSMQSTDLLGVFIFCRIFFNFSKSIFS